MKPKPAINPLTVTVAFETWELLKSVYDAAERVSPPVQLPEINGKSAKAKSGITRIKQVELEEEDEEGEEEEIKKPFIPKHPPKHTKAEKKHSKPPTDNSFTAAMMKRIREKLGWTQLQMAEHFEKSQGWTAQIESGKIGFSDTVRLDLEELEEDLEKEQLSLLKSKKPKTPEPKSSVVKITKAKGKAKRR